MPSFVCSHACVTGKYSIGECFGETWIRAPNKGAIIFWGSSANTLWDEDDILEKETLAEYDNFQPVAEMTDRGKLDLYAHYGGGGYTKYYFECYNIFGDPSVIIGVPRSGGGGGGGNGSGGVPNIVIPPRVGISRPSNNEVVSGLINISGYSYDLNGQIKYVFIKIGNESWVQADGIYNWNIVWDTTTVSDGKIVISAVSINKKGIQSPVDYVTIEVRNSPDPEPELFSDLFCNGSINWVNIKPNIFTYSDFTLENIGDEGSLLNWEVSEYPEDWGTWAINPSSGENLTVENGKIKVRVSVLTPEEPEQNFTGEIKIINKDNPDDYEIIPISLSTSKNKRIDFGLLIQQFLNNHPYMFPILRKIIGL
jgi:hypothetical protein